MKKIIVCLLLLSFLLTFLTSCHTETPEKDKDHTESTTEQAENSLPDEVSNEEKYKPILDIYKNTVINLDNQLDSNDKPYAEGTQEYQWWSAIFGAVGSYHLSTHVPGYVFYDLNQNGNDEMLLLLDDYTVLAIFSFSDGKPILLDNYWNRKKCTIDGNGTIQVYGSGGTGISSFSIFKISDDDKEFVLLEEYGMDGYDIDTGIYYCYKKLNGTKTPITVLEYTAALSQGVYSSVEELAKHTKENADFEFVPLELDYKKVFEKILNYEMKINSENKYLWEFYFSFETNSIGSLESVEICYLDMDGDGISELLLRSDIHDHLILRYHRGTVYLYEYSYKEMARVYEDGSYNWHSQTYLEDNSVCYGTSKITFDKNEKNKERSLYTIWDGENESYFMINGKLTSKNEVDALVESRKNIKEVTWTTYTLDPDKIPAAKG